MGNKWCKQTLKGVLTSKDELKQIRNSDYVSNRARIESCNNERFETKSPYCTQWFQFLRNLLFNLVVWPCSCETIAGRLMDYRSCDISCQRGALVAGRKSVGRCRFPPLNYSGINDQLAGSRKRLAGPSIFVSLAEPRRRTLAPMSPGRMGM